MSKSRAKGTRFESEVVMFLRAAGFPKAERKSLHGRLDEGDLTGVPGWSLELKATQHIDLAAAVDEARVAAINGQTLWYAAIVKRRRRSIGESYAVLPLALFARLVSELGALKTSQSSVPAHHEEAATNGGIGVGLRRAAGRRAVPVRP